MSNDKVFAFYAFGLIAMVGTMWASLVAVGFATLPSMAFFVEHVALGLLIRAAYKSFAGFDWLFSGLQLAGLMSAPSEAAPSEVAHIEPAAEADLAEAA